MTAIDRTLHRHPSEGARQGGWTYLVMADPAEYLGTRGPGPHPRRIDGLPFRGSFVTLGDGTRKLAVKADVRAQIGKEAGGVVTIHVEKYIPPTPRRSAP